MTGVRFCRRFLACAAVVLAGAGAGDPMPTNPDCPVLPGEATSAGFRTEFRGRTVYFCCADCVARFEATPETYAANLPPIVPKSLPKTEPIGTVDSVLGVLGPALDWSDRHFVIVVVLAAVFVLGLATRLRAKRDGVRGPTGVAVVAGHLFRPFPVAVILGLGILADHVHAEIPSATASAFVHRHPILLGAMAAVLAVGLTAHVFRGRRFLAVIGYPGNVVAVLAVGGLVVLGREYTAKANALIDANYREGDLTAALVSHGPRVLTWDWPNGLHALPKGVKNTYYRGNDERSDELFHGGDYRTATFHVGLTDESGKDVNPGPVATGTPLRIHWEIVRSPKTAEHFFGVKTMEKCFFAADHDAKQPVVRLASADPEQRWAADLPIGEAPAANGYKAVRGVWYCCLAKTDDPAERTLARALVHYYVQYVLHFRDGQLLPNSTVWMMPVYPSPILNGPTADGEWFSDRPIPEIAGENATDPKLLGVPGAE